MTLAPIANLTLIGSFIGGVNAATLVNGDFEDNTLSAFGTVVSDFVVNQGIWGRENGSLTGTVGAVNPLGSQMLQMNPSGSSSQTIQLVDLSAHAADISAGNAFLNFSALFNIDSTGANANVAVRFFSANNWPSAQISFPSGPGLALDDNPETWESVAINTAIPTTATWAGLEVQYAGSITGFVDNAALSVTTVPEPSSALLLALAGSSGLLFRRRR